MEEKAFIWTDELVKRMLRLRFDNDRVFKSMKQPWAQFRNILLENGFPNEMSLDHLRKKWSYTWDMYKLAKKEKNKQWKYYKIFEKHFGQTETLDWKYESWSDEWRLKLITCLTEAKEHMMDHQTMWRTIESAMRCQDLPEDCCVQDMQGLWHHIKKTFIRKHRVKIKRGSDSSEWPLYSTMLEYYGKHEPELLVNMESENHSLIVIPKLKTMNRRKDFESETKANVGEFQWSKDITESFIQVRLQNDWLFNQRIQAWKDFVVILREEHGFPSTLTSREAGKKWASTFSEYQKAKATNNKSWVYYNLFEVYLGEGSLSLNPLLDWHEDWALEFIEARTSLEDFFIMHNKVDPSKCWREVEKNLRRNGIPLDHSLLDLPNIWSYLLRTYRWKKKFADKGVLKEHWPYFDAMKRYMEIQESRKQAIESMDNHDGTNDDYEDDMKLFDLKQKMEIDLKPTCELGGNQCRACANVDACVDIFEHKDDDDLDVASKLRLVCGIEVERSERLPSQICYNCLQELENAYKFRRKCQDTDKHFRDSGNDIKIEILGKMDDSGDQDTAHDDDDVTHDEADDTRISQDINAHDLSIPKGTIVKKVAARKRVLKRKYEYFKVCEICGKHTKNLKSHVDAHNVEKPYSCNICGKKFKFRNGLIIHKAVHDPTPRKTCEICGKTFHVLAHYRRHFAHHANERKYACDTCGARFNSLDILRVHTRIHTDERPFDCSECGKTFRTAGCVTRHKRIVHRIIKRKVE